MDVDPALFEALFEVYTAARAAYEKPSVRASNPDLGRALSRIREVPQTETKPDENDDPT